MKLIVGLGNVGKQYEASRHNIGFMVVDELARRWGLTWRSDKLSFVAELHSPYRLLLLKPKTYMNLSGEAVRHYADFYRVADEEIAIIQDDLDLPAGKSRVRRKGSAGGHNGLKSVIQHLGTTEFARFKIGIGHPGEEKKTVINHVLTKFNEEEKKEIQKAVDKTADAVITWLDEGIDVAMNRFNS